METLNNPFFVILVGVATSIAPVASVVAGTGGPATGSIGSGEARPAGGATSISTVLDDVGATGSSDPSDPFDLAIASLPDTGSAADAPKSARTTGVAVDRVETNIATARQMTEAWGGEPGDIETMTEIGRIATLHTLDTAGGQPTSMPSTVQGTETAGLSEALSSLLTQYEVTVSPEERARIAALGDLPDQQQASLAQLLAAFVAYAEATDHAIDTLLDDGPPIPPLERSAATTPLSPSGGDAAMASLPDALHVPASDDPGLVAEFVPVLEARLDLLEAVESVARSLEAPPTGAGLVVELCPALALDLAGEDRRYTEDCGLILDVGGNDTYVNNAGGSSVTGLDDCAPQTMSDLENQLLRAGALVDLEGDDRYGRQEVSRGPPGFYQKDARVCGTNGGGTYGAGFLLDARGDDLYRGNAEVNDGLTTRARVFGTNGGGWVGTGFLLDGDGTDTYQASAQAHAIGGASAAVEGANGGVFGGSGTLLDLGPAERTEVLDARATAKAADTHQGAIGTNGGARDGVSILVNEEGPTRYLASGGQVSLDGVDGGGTNGGATGLFVVPTSALLLDGDGQDLYRGDRATNGATGFTGASATLFDLGGNDTYEAISHANGAAFGASAALLLDAEGSDRYTVGDGHQCTGGCSITLANGGAVTGVARLLDIGGDDRYTVAEGATCTTSEESCILGTASNGGVRELGSALLYDIAGDDLYEVGQDATCQVEDAECVIGSRGVNGGSYARVALLLVERRTKGMLIDGGGSDAYSAGEGARCQGAGHAGCVLGAEGVNGGGYSGAFLPSGQGSLYDQAGDDRFSAGVQATCELDAPEAVCRRGEGGVNGGATGALGSLVDAGGSDLYLEPDDACRDCTTVPKGELGAQVDLPSEAS